jgi:hypothetical protein
MVAYLHEMRRYGIRRCAAPTGQRGRCVRHQQ